MDSIDSVAGGLKCGDMTVVGARPSVGKTAFATQIACSAARLGKRVLFVSLEMFPRDLVCRIAAANGVSDNRTLRSEQLSEAEWDSLAAEANVGKAYR